MSGSSSLVHADALLWLWVAFIVSFGFIRFSTRMIRAQVSWWPGNVSVGGRHIHHVVPGVILVCAAGIASFTGAGGSGGVRYASAVVFGVGAALMLDEFALILHLRDVYWSGEGRSSVDAVILAVAATGLVLAGATPFGVGSRTNGTGWVLAGAVVINLVFVSVALLKGKVWTGLLGIFVPLLACFGAVRVGRPGSPWARWRYPPGSARLARATRRETRRTWLIRLKERLQDLVAGRPHLPSS
jgi:hypothetical protein